MSFALLLLVVCCSLYDLSGVVECWPLLLIVILSCVWYVLFLFVVRCSLFVVCVWFVVCRVLYVVY